LGLGGHPLIYFFNMKRSVITGTGSFLPTLVKKNADFAEQTFYTEDRLLINGKKEAIIEKFQKITGIEERRYTTADLAASDLAAIAGNLAINDSKIDRETLDLIIVAHNFGDISSNGIQSDAVPALASRVKHQLVINNPNCIGYDLLFGCPGWLMAMIQAEAFFKSGMAQKALIIGAETLSRVIDPYDRDSMIFSDGAGAIVLEYMEAGEGGMLASSAVSHCLEEVHYLTMDASFGPESSPDVKYLKMKGRKVYEYALKHVPVAMKACLDKSGAAIGDLKKIFIHQANEKMDEAIVGLFYQSYGVEAPKDIMPMCIHYLGNSSVATIPTLLDLVSKGCYPDHSLSSGDLVMFASVGAGMNINAVCYRYI
jgi:3-oxoacyl-[acyl-carrier-protein] synthase III